jgi:hypothetical protein
MNAIATLSPKTRPTASQAYSQAKHLQALCIKMADDDQTKSGYLAQLCRAWKELEELKREIKGIGRPKAVTARNDKGHRASNPVATPRSLAARRKALGDSVAQSETGITKGDSAEAVKPIPPV